jgi:hypothetical protein
MITRGATFPARPVVLKLLSVMPQTGVASEPAYVVGIARMGTSSVSATALANPTAEAPPTVTIQSALVSMAICRATPASSAGT